MKAIMKSIQFTGLAILAVLITCSASWATTYYLDATNGNDGNDGLSELAAWQTIARVNSSTFQPGDYILFRRGEAWREQLVVPSSGLSGNPITFGAYGNGDKPVMDGDDTRDFCIYAENKSYITIENLNFIDAAYAGIYNIKGDSWTVKDCTFSGHAVDGILLRGHNTEDEPISGCAIYDNTLTLDSSLIDAGIKVRGALGAVIRNNIISILSSGAAIGTSAGGADGAGATSSSTEIYENDVTAMDGGGILVQYTNNAHVYRNYVHDGKGFGIAINRYSDNALVEYNIVHSLTHASGYLMNNGIDINVGCDNGEAYNNTVYSVGGFCLTIESNVDPCDGWVIKNNILDSSQNEQNEFGNNASIYIQSGVTTYAFDSNLYNIDQAIKRGGGVTIDNITTWNDKAEVGTDYLADPLFTEPGSGSFTLQSGSPAINAGTNLGTSHDDALDLNSSWPASVVTKDQDNFGNEWEIGAYLFDPTKMAPSAPKGLRIVDF